jgi:AGZA family xanthine/uracil permease-like MFS transporter
MLFLSTSYYAWLAYELARRPGAATSARCRPGRRRAHVHRGLRVMLPIKLQTGDPIKAGKPGSLGGHQSSCSSRRLHRP